MQIEPHAPTPDWESFEFALECADTELRCYYDTVTGEVCITGPFEDDPGEREKIDGDPQRFPLIERLDSRETYQWMERFAAEQVSDGTLRTRLFRALNRPKPFRRFKDELSSSREYEQAWYAYRNRLMWRAIERWFEDHGLAVGAAPWWWTPGATRPPGGPGSVRLGQSST